MQGLSGQFIVAAVQYWHAAKALNEFHANSRDRLPMFYPLGHLSGMCAELTLKAHLLSVGFTKEKLAKQPYGHDLSHILKKCVMHGLRLDADEANAVLMIHQTHIDHFYRYGWKRVPEIRQLPNFDICIDLLARVIDRVSDDPTELRERNRPTPTSNVPDPAEEIRELVTMDLLAELQSAIDTKNEWLRSVENKTRSKNGLPPLPPRKKR